MSYSEIESTIKRILIQDLQVDAVVIENADVSTPLLGWGVGLDSIEALRLGLGLENAFDISIPDADLNVDLFSSLGGLANYIEQKIAAKHTAIRA